MISIINYGSGNVRAIANIYEQLNICYNIVDNPNDFPDDTSKIILPGVGAFDETMSNLNDSGFRSLLDLKVLQEKIPVLGICVGMQILASESEEGRLPGLGWINGKVKKFELSKLNFKPKIPHLGWNSIKSENINSRLFDGVEFERGFYFIHSFYFDCDNSSNILSRTEYGTDFVSAVNNENIYGVQFHPEKSHKNGIQLLKNFNFL